MLKFERALCVGNIYLVIPKTDVLTRTVHSSIDLDFDFYPHLIIMPEETTEKLPQIPLNPLHLLQKKQQWQRWVDVLSFQ